MLFNASTGELEPAHEAEGSTWSYDVSGDELTLTPDINQQLRSLFEFVEEDLELDPEQDLGMVFDLENEADVQATIFEADSPTVTASKTSRLSLLHGP